MSRLNPVADVELSASADSVTIDASGSYSQVGETLTFKWFINDECLDFVTGSSFTITNDDLQAIVEAFGTSFDIKVTVSDSQGTDTEEVTVSENVDSCEDGACGDDDNCDDCGGDAGATIPAPTTWEEWIPARPDLDISEKRGRAFVERAIEKLDTQYALTTIPSVTPGNPVPAENLITRDRSIRLIFNEGDGLFIEQEVQKASPAQIARINIRANLRSMKQKIVNDIATMLTIRPPRRLQGGSYVAIPITDSDKERISNNLANAYILTVDKFLKDNPTARPLYGATATIRKRLTEKGYLAAVPWCDTWAKAINNGLQFLNSAKYGVPDPVNPNDNLPVIEYDRVQWNYSVLPIGNGVQRQHNWVVVQSAGYPDVKTKTTTDLTGVFLVYFDPWWDILPRVAKPGEQPYLSTNWSGNLIDNENPGE